MVAGPADRRSFDFASRDKTARSFAQDDTFKEGRYSESTAIIHCRMTAIGFQVYVGVNTPYGNRKLIRTCVTAWTGVPLIT